jgi:hypothetical protein
MNYYFFHVFNCEELMMKKILIAAACVLSLNAGAVESEVQFENDQVRILSVKILAHEEIGLHRDAYPHVVMSIKGGTITRLEADGSKTEVHFPKGEAVFREADPVGAMHTSVNNTCKPIELVVVQLKSNF